MADVGLRVDGLGKRYRISHLERGRTIRAAAQDFFSAPGRRIRQTLRPGQDELIWALRDASFELKRGDVLGLVGRNGAGKSTLLKILSRITEPTEGHAEVYGRLSSLLEVGTGFHPELSGRDNIFLNGAILGMRRTEVVAKFDSIVEFAGVEKFIDTPVKRYSSGMYLRLAFAVAAHLEPDVLLVDEVLAVGDREFQRHSLEKMREATIEGGTVIFVSHNMDSVRSLCNRALWLADGRMRMEGQVDEVVEEYLSAGSGPSAAGFISSEIPRLGTGEARLTRVELCDLAGRRVADVSLGEPLVVIVHAEIERQIADAVFEVGIATPDGMRLTTTFSSDGDAPPFDLGLGQAAVAVELEPALFPGRYLLDVGLHHLGTRETIDAVDGAFEFSVLNEGEESTDYPTTAVRGYVRPPARWSPAGLDAPKAVWEGK